MKPTDFSVHVTNFLTHYLSAQRNLSANTIKAYRDVFTLLLRYCRDVRRIAPEKLCLEQIDVSLVEGFLDHLGTARNSSPRTRNHRLAALHAFFRYVQAEEPTHMLQCQKILAIPQQRHARPARQRALRTEDVRGDDGQAGVLLQQAADFIRDGEQGAPGTGPAPMGREPRSCSGGSPRAPGWTRS